MEVLLSKVTQQAMNYAIRTGITITSGFAIQQCGRLLKSVKSSSDKTELVNLQMRLESKIRIISPSIDMIEMMAARGNTTLESAVTLTKALRWDIQTLGVRLSKAAADEELARQGSSRAKSAVQSQMELKSIIADIKNLLQHIERSVPDINLAIATSGVNFTTRMPDHISPSRLLQASTLLTSGDAQYSVNPTRGAQICPDFIVSMWMLFAGHVPQEQRSREYTWQEVLHKARLKIQRVPLDQVYDYPGEQCSRNGRRHSASSATAGNMSGDGKAYEYAYQLLIVEDYDDGRVHDDEEPAAPYEGVERPGIRELIPVHEISKIFYADTSKLLNIGTDSETNSPVLLLKRDINAIPPRRMMQRQTPPADQYEEYATSSPPQDLPSTPQYPDEQSEIDAQLHRESPAPQTPQSETLLGESPSVQSKRIPPNLDPEWIAFEVYTEDTIDSDSDGDADESEIPSSQPGTPASQHSWSRRSSVEPTLMSAFSRLNFRSSPASNPTPQTPCKDSVASQVILSPDKHTSYTSQESTVNPLPMPIIRTSLSLLEMLIRLTSLQQFQQTSHLAIPDELLTFFLSESSTVGAGGDTDLRQRVRRDARRRVGFDPYDESPIKRRGEAYLAQAHDDKNYDNRHYATSEDYPGDDRYYDGGRGIHDADTRFSPSPTSLPRDSPRLLQSTPYHGHSPSSPSPTYHQHWGSQSSLTAGRRSAMDGPMSGRESGMATQQHNRAAPSPLLRRATAPNAKGGSGTGHKGVSSFAVDASAPSSSPRVELTEERRRDSGWRDRRPSTPGERG
ncbi:Ran-binding-domain-containing protein [Pseudovirgaria hyperparasitica]|uniref:Ran-binding-domain-containing protein n=1 Tax=Pseudovirgaria hyperparasitica TaxID=470096 RepID=A0A6A6WEP3_9PEZI|nr:Ran-binding-domain-containing protein [Pseudovirgaria hyperparasitica]KAF2760356.1 Ran-binding-domain-containing protein [Pseudovirgaria hyperparasitica]